MTRNQGGIFVTATDTEVGKTFLSALLLVAMRIHGVEATYFKPVATGCIREGQRLLSEDVSFVSRMTGLDLGRQHHCPVRYERPLAPLAAARIEKQPLDLDAIRQALARLRERHGFVVVEGVGGVMVPLKERYLLLDFMAEVGYPAIVVSRPGLGTINHTLLTLEALKARSVPILGFVTNGERDETDEAAPTSPPLISEFSQIPYLGHVPFLSPDEKDPVGFLTERAPFLLDLTSRLPGPSSYPKK
jgi:dethiobiotin synthetase